MQYAGRLIVAGLCGAVIAWTIGAIVLHSIFASGGYTREALVELSPWAFGMIGICDGAAGFVLAAFAGKLNLRCRASQQSVYYLLQRALLDITCAHLEHAKHFSGLAFLFLT